jgi:hypothetical protein
MQPRLEWSLVGERPHPELLLYGQLAKGANAVTVDVTVRDEQTPVDTCCSGRAWIAKAYDFTSCW